jgi:hypothetical protein
MVVSIPGLTDSWVLAIADNAPKLKHRSDPASTMNGAQDIVAGLFGDVVQSLAASAPVSH